MTDAMHANLPPHIDPEQFKKCVDIWNSDKEIAKINKATRSKKTANNKTGSTSYCDIKEQLKDEGLQPTRIQTLNRVVGLQNDNMKKDVDYYHSEEIRTKASTIHG